MTLASQLQAGFTRVAEEINALRSEQPAGMYLISRQQLGADAGVINFASIPQTYESLVLIASLRSTQASTFSGLRIFINNDTNVNAYMYERLQGTSAAASGAEFLLGGGSGHTPGLICAANGKSNSFSRVEIQFSNYRDQMVHEYTVINQAIWSDTTGGMQGRISAAWHNNDAAITRIELAPGAGNFKALSKASLYGIK